MRINVSRSCTVWLDSARFGSIRLNSAWFASDSFSIELPCTMMIMHPRVAMWPHKWPRISHRNRCSLSACQFNWRAFHVRVIEQQIVRWHLQCELDWIENQSISNHEKAIDGLFCLTEIAEGRSIFQFAAAREPSDSANFMKSHAILCNRTELNEIFFFF